MLLRDLVWAQQQLPYSRKQRQTTNDLVFSIDISCILCCFVKYKFLTGCARYSPLVNNKKVSQPIINRTLPLKQIFLFYDFRWVRSQLCAIADITCTTRDAIVNYRTLTCRSRRGNITINATNEWEYYESPIRDLSTWILKLLLMIN